MKKQRLFSIVRKQNFTTMNAVPYRPTPQRWQWPSYANLPVQPVPCFQSTMDVFLKFARHVVSDREYSETVKLLRKFAEPNGEGEKLQLLLTSKAEYLENWLAEWWLVTAYLIWRNPLPINTTPGLSFPAQSFNGLNGQIQFASHLLEAMLYFKQLIDEKRLPVSMSGKDPLDMSQYDLLFGTCRVPGIEKDWLKYGCDAKHPVNHITVLRNDHIFLMPVYDDCMRPLSRDQIAQQLNVVIEDSQATSSYSVGSLTALDRTSWAITYQQLKRDRINRWILERVEESLFVLCLDKAPQETIDKENYSETDQFRLKQSEMGKQLLHGNGSKQNGGNRWYDKTIQIIVGEGGICGLAYEHSPAEGPPIATMMDETIQYCQSGKRAEKAAAPIKSPMKLNFIIDDTTKLAIKEASRLIDKSAGSLEVNIFCFTKFGKSVPKSFNLSPDSFIQMALQLAYFRVHNEFAPTYETGTLRKFKLGRTDTIRLPNAESVAFVQGMESSSDKARLLRTAVAAHKAYTLRACSGQGMDRHLLGLKLIASENGLSVPELLKGPAFTKMGHFKLSTSQVPAKEDGSMVFGPMVLDGYGFCYNPKEEKFNLSVTSFKSCSATSAFRLGEAIEQSLVDLRDILQQETLKSKL